LVSVHRPINRPLIDEAAEATIAAAFELQKSRVSSATSDAVTKTGGTIADLERLTRIPTSTISRWQNKQALPGLDGALRLAEAAGVSLDWMAGREGATKAWPRVGNPADLAEVLRKYVADRIAREQVARSEAIRSTMPDADRLLDAIVRRIGRSIKAEDDEELISRHAGLKAEIWEGLERHDGSDVNAEQTQHLLRTAHQMDELPPKAEASTTLGVQVAAMGYRGWWANLFRRWGISTETKAEHEYTSHRAAEKRDAVARRIAGE
jgi:transcriptional regulator with XRE-family HTH domain